MSAYERDPAFPDGQAVRLRNEPLVRGRIVGFDVNDGEYLVFVFEATRGSTLAGETTWWDFGHFELDPDPHPWPGEERLPLGVFALHRPKKGVGVELFASIEALINADALAEEEGVYTAAMECVANPGEPIQVGTYMLSFLLIEGGDTRARERRASDQDSSP